jgi:uroporphyrinogen decarboxylase
MSLTSEERIIKTLQHEEVDRIPIFEWFVDQKVIEAIYPGLSYQEFVYKADHDAICVDLNYKSEELEPQIYRDEWGIVKQDTGESHTYPIDGPIKTRRDFDRYEPPDPHAPERYLTLESDLKAHQGKKAIILHLNDVFSIPSRLMGFEHFLMTLIEDPKLIEGLIDMCVEVNLKMADEAVKRGVKIIYTGDDFAHQLSPMVSPSHFEKIFYPPLCRVMGGFKDRGLYIIKHTDGEIMSLIDMIVDSGIDCLDPIDPTAGMDLAEIKSKYGQRIALKGNVDCAQTLTFGSVEETIAESKKCIQIAGPGGGYIFSSGNSIHSAVKPENYIAMMNTHREYGNYPIQI